MSDKLWGGRFTKTTDQLVEEFTSSISFDRRLYRQDIAGSIAHARMLGRQGIITPAEAETIIRGLESIRADIEQGCFSFDTALEDIHMNIEKRLSERIGPVGGKLHTARSRNDQVALDTHLYLRGELGEIARLLADLQAALLDVAQRHDAVIMPGYTHLQRAQPILFAHHLLAYFQMLQRDFDRLGGVYQRTDMMPLGAGALAGTTLPIDRQAVAEELHFAAVYDNSLDAVSDRDYILEFLSFAAILMMHLSRLSEELILWSSAEFAFIELDDAHCTGSSIMPQKKNPDVAELVRGKTGRVFGHLLALLTLCKGLPLAYNKDLQEDKEALFDTVDTVKASLQVYAAMLRGLTVRRENMRRAAAGGFTNATDMADYLVRKGLPFRQAHAVVGQCVQYCLQHGRDLLDLTDDELQSFSPLIGPDVRQAIAIETCVAQRDSFGGTSPRQVQSALARAAAALAANRRSVDKYAAADI